MYRSSFQLFVDRYCKLERLVYLYLFAVLHYFNIIQLEERSSLRYEFFHRFPGFSIVSHRRNRKRHVFCQTCSLDADARSVISQFD